MFILLNYFVRVVISVVHTVIRFLCIFILFKIRYVSCRRVQRVSVDTENELT